MNTANRIALMLLITLAAAAPAQQWHHEADLRADGEVVWSTSVEADLDRDVPSKQYTLTLLPPAFTGAGYKYEVDYTMTRTKTSYPYWNAYARIDAPAADGQTWGRNHNVNFAGTQTGSWSFHSEDHASVRPHRIRFTFSQPATFPYKFGATIRARRVASANIGGALRETPSYVQVGTAMDPAWVNGDLWMTVTNHRWMLFVLEAGQQLRVKTRYAPGVTANAAILYGSVYNLNHELIGSPGIYIAASGDYDQSLYLNTTGARQWIILGMRSGGNIKPNEMGFYSPQGASPGIGLTVPAPTAAELNPYAAGVRDVQSWTGAGGAVYSMNLPGDGEMIRIALRIKKDAWLGGGTGALARCTVYAADDTIVKEFSFASDPYGLDVAESFYELDRSTVAAKRPARIVLTTMYAAHVLTADATRHARTR